MSTGGGSSGGQNTTVSQQQIPQYEQQFSSENQDLARSLASQPYPQYGGALIAGQNNFQDAGQKQAIQSSYNWQPGLQQAGQTAAGALNPSMFNGILGQANSATTAGTNANPFQAYALAAQDQIGVGTNGSTVAGAQGAQANAAGQAQALTNPNAVGAYMNPFIEQALAPQVQDLQLQLASQQQGINAQAAQAGAYGDARQGAMGALQNLYGNQAMNQLIGTGYNNAFTQALSALGQAQNTQLGAAGQYGNIAQTGLGEQNVQLQGAQQLAAIGGQQQNEQQIQLQAGQNFANQAGLVNTEQNTQLSGAQLQAALANQLQQQSLTGANAVYNVGQQDQTQQQNELNAAYQQYLNQVNWPYQMLNVREGALSNSPYNIQTAVTLPSANSTAQGFGTLASAAGLLGSLSGSGGGTAPFGGTKMQ